MPFMENINGIRPSKTDCNQCCIGEEDPATATEVHFRTKVLFFPLVGSHKEIQMSHEADNLISRNFPRLVKNPKKLIKQGRTKQGQTLYF